VDNEDQEFWKALLSNRNLRSRFIRDLEIQSIVSGSTEDLLNRYKEEEIMPRAAHSRHKLASSPS
jgi:hypothetical protein